MEHHRVPPRPWLVTVALTACALVPVSCASGDGDTAGGGLTVPVLWAARTPEGDAVGGIEPATVDVRTDTEAEFAVLLDSIVAEGAGPMWLATSALAAALATLNAGVDPRLVDVDFTITGPIDGPSGGAILTIGTLAAMRGHTLRSEVTMTGTIAPDGTIGMVGEIPTKIAAAAEAGFRTVLVPFGAGRRFTGPFVGADGSPITAADLVAYGAALGVDVIEVGHLDIAYEAFTGSSLTAATAGSTALDPSVVAVTEERTAALVQQCRTLLDGMAAELDVARRDELTRLVERLEASAASGPTATTYGLGIDVLQQLTQSDGRHRTAAHVADDGLDIAWGRLAAQVETLIGLNGDALRRYSSVDGLGVEQVLSLPFALGWFTYETGVLAAIAERLDGTPDLATLEQLAPAVAESSVAITTFGPDAVAIVIASSSEPVSRPDELASFVSGYVDFIDRSADFTADYARIGSLSALPTDPITVLAALRTQEPPVEPGDSALRRVTLELAHATSKFVLAESVVSGASFGLAGFGIGADPVAYADAVGLLDLSVRSGVTQARLLGSTLVENGSGLDYVLWQADLAEGISASLAGDPRLAAAEVIALNELWYAVINAQMVSASRNAIRFD
jgi:hypothetical protein